MEAEIRRDKEELSISPYMWDTYLNVNIVKDDLLASHQSINNSGERGASEFYCNFLWWKQ